MQRVKPKLKKLQQDPNFTPSISIAGIRPKQFVDQHDYHISKQGKVQDISDHDSDMSVCC